MKKNAILIIGIVFCISSCVYALGQRTAVKYTRAIAINLELTPEQVDSLTKQQAATYIKNTYPAIPVAKLKEASTYWPGIKIMLRNDAIERQMQSRIALLKQQIEANYPDAICLNTQHAKDIARQLIPLLYGEVDPNALY